MNNVTCRFCDKNIALHVLKRHENKCIFNPTNVSKLCNYLTAILEDYELCNKITYSEYAKVHNLPTAKTLADIFNTNSWQNTIITVILAYYSKGFIKSLEEYDFFIFHLTYGGMGYSSDNLTNIMDQILEKELNEFPISDYISLNYNTTIGCNGYEMLYVAIIYRAIRDLLSPGEFDENRLPINKKEAREFLLDICPAILNKLNV